LEHYGADSGLHLVAVVISLSILSPVQETKALSAFSRSRASNVAMLRNDWIAYPKNRRSK
jgi:hypothetical protein